MSAPNVESEYGIPDAMVKGLQAKTKRMGPVPPHPLETSEKSYHARMENLEFALLRKMQGLHAPLQLKMERKLTLQNGHLPCLPRHNFSYNVLTGRDETIGFEDYLGHPEDRETMAHPHAIMESHLGKF